MWMEEESRAVIEAILFANGTAVEKEKLAQFLNLNLAELQRILENLAEVYSTSDRGIELTEDKETVRLGTKTALAETLDNWFKVPSKRLSQAVLETLAVIAYRQPVTRAEIEDIRGVRADKALQSLLEKELICEAGIKDAPGKPILYATTSVFLQVFGLNSLNALPPLEAE